MERKVDRVLSMDCRRIWTTVQELGAIDASMRGWGQSWPWSPLPAVAYWTRQIPLWPAVISLFFWFGDHDTKLQNSWCELVRVVPFRAKYQQPANLDFCRDQVTYPAGSRLPAFGRYPFSKKNTVTSIGNDLVSQSRSWALRLLLFKKLKPLDGRIEEMDESKSSSKKKTAKVEQIKLLVFFQTAYQQWATGLMKRADFHTMSWRDVYSVAYLHLRV